MKTKNMFWAALSMTVALMMTACGSDNDMTETPVAPSTSKIIPYTVTVSDDAATTRATLGDDNRTLKFATGDKLYITGWNTQGVLNLQAGDENKTSGATFSGELIYTGPGSPADHLELTATLVSAQQTDGNEVTINTTTGAVTVNYPTTAYCADVATAVKKYSNLTGTSTYGAKSFALTQQTAFLNFEITFEDGTTSGTTLAAVVSNNQSDLCTANVTTTTESTKVVAKFVLPVDARPYYELVIQDAKVTMGGKCSSTHRFGNPFQVLEGKVYNVKRTQTTYTMAANAVADDGGRYGNKLICTDGHIHAYNEDAGCTKARVAKIIYVGSSTDNDTYNHGLALALNDESSSMDWETSMTTCSTNKNTSTPVTDAFWMLPSMAQINTMIDACEYSSYLRNSFSRTGGTNMQGYYWTSSEVSNTKKWYIGESTGGVDEKDVAYNVRACLVF